MSTADGDLVYADTDTPGISRRRCGRGWQYRNPDGSRITDPAVIRRLHAIALPPAYRDCWYSIDHRAHILAFGFDARGRRQYRYHPRYRAAREESKFERLVDFGRALPGLRRRIERDIDTGSPRDRIIASLVRLIDQSALRVGNAAYAKANGSFGATTLRKRHAQITRGQMILRFPAKGGQKTEVRLTDARLARIARQCQDLPGQRLFAFIENGVVRDVGSSDVNAYLAEVCGAPVTAKYFRTWAGSLAAFEAALADPAAINVSRLAEAAAAVLRNTPAIARKSYIHPAVLALDRETLAEQPYLRSSRYMRASERRLLAFLEVPHREIGR